MVRYVLFLVFLITVSVLASAKPCCPEDPENMTFGFIRNNPDYLIGNHVGDELPFAVKWWFYKEKANVYSYEGIFVIGFEIRNGKVAGYSEVPYGSPTINFYAKEDALNRIWQSDHLVLQFFYELWKKNILIRNVFPFWH